MRDATKVEYLGEYSEAAKTEAPAVVLPVKPGAESKGELPANVPDLTVPAGDQGAID